MAAGSSVSLLKPCLAHPLRPGNVDPPRSCLSHCSRVQPHGCQRESSSPLIWARLAWRWRGSRVSCLSAAVGTSLYKELGWDWGAGIGTEGLYDFGTKGSWLMRSHFCEGGTDRLGPKGLEKPRKELVLETTQGRRKQDVGPA